MSVRLKSKRKKEKRNPIPVNVKVRNFTLNLAHNIYFLLQVFGKYESTERNIKALQVMPFLYRRFLIHVWFKSMIYV